MAPPSINIPAKFVLNAKPMAIPANLPLFAAKGFATITAAHFSAPSATSAVKLSACR